MPIFKLDVCETVYYRRAFIEADNEDEAKYYFQTLMSVGLIETIDSDGMVFTDVEEIQKLPEHSDLFTKEECEEFE